MTSYLSHVWIQYLSGSFLSTDLNWVKTWAEEYLGGIHPKRGEGETKEYRVEIPWRRGGAREKTDEYLVEFYNGTMVHSRKGYLDELIVSEEYKGELNLYKRPVLVLIQIQL